MLLETLDVRKNDVVIFSENKPDLENNFKIVFKQSTSRKPIKISYAELCDFVYDPSPKNLIVYRLLTNIRKLDPYSSEYGCFLTNSGNMELFYFDPYFAVKDLKYLTKNIDHENLRFKIQQVGLTTMASADAENSFTEVFNVDLKAIEAQNQNDKIFADAIFLFDETYNEEDTEKIPSFGAEDFNKDEIDNLEKLREVGKEHSSSIVKIAFDKDEEEIEFTEKNKDTKRVFSKFIQKHKIEIEENKMHEEDEDESSLDLFNRKNINKKRVLREDTVILKFEDD